MRHATLRTYRELPRPAPSAQRSATALAQPHQVRDAAAVGAGAVLLVAHGSGDPAAEETTCALGRGVAAALPGREVRTAFLDHSWPRPDEALAALPAAGRERTVVVPLLLTAAYHVRVDLPAVLARAPGAEVSRVLGPVDGVVPEPLVAALRRRLEEGTGGDYDAVVLAAAGTRDAAARQTVRQSARALSATLDVACRVGFASACDPTPAAATAALRAAGARRVAVAGYFLAPGKLYRAAVDGACAAGAVAAAAPLGDATELVRLIVSRVAAAESR